MRFIFGFLCLMFFANGHAEDSTPASCKPIAVQGESVTLTATTPLLIIIHNLSKSDLWITHPVSEPSASVGWSSRLQAGNWSALALDKKSFELSCIESKPGHEQQVSCSGAISVCEWPAVKMPAQATGTFWAGEDMTVSALIEHLGSRGFALPTKTQ